MAAGKKAKKIKSPDLNEMLIENFANLQKVLTNLTIKFDKLADEISKLLNLFEITAKDFVKKTEEGKGKVIGKERQLTDKLDSLIEQNKVVAKGLIEINKKLGKSSEEKIRTKPKPLPKL